ncbi:hypothetical protein CR513_10414, partial [Mucuna pruriens]
MDPLSPYLFVFSIERLGHLIFLTVNKTDKKPIKVRKIVSPSPTYFLWMSSSCSGKPFESMSISMTRIFVSKSVSRDKAMEFSSLAKFSLTNDLGSARRTSNISLIKFKLDFNLRGSSLSQSMVAVFPIYTKQTIPLLNSALMMKLGLRLINKLNAFWVQVLHFKYKCMDSLIPIMEQKKNWSKVWKEIVTSFTLNTNQL